MDGHGTGPISAADFRISSVKLSGFRGVPGTLDVSFAPPGKPATSIIIFGDNGSGKSSIVDAVEWACQGKVGRSANKGPARPNLINYTRSDRSCACEVILDSGQIVRRSLKLGADDRWWLDGDPPLPTLGKVPMSLKRADILRFLDTAPVTRGALFVDHALDGGKPPVAQLLTVEQEAIRDEILALKSQVREIAADLARTLQIEPAPRDLTQIERMIQVEVYMGLDIRDWPRVTVAKPIKESVLAIDALRVKITKANRRAQTLKSTSGGYPARLQEMQVVLGDVSDWLTSAFLEVTRATHVARIAVLFGRISSVSLEIEVEIVNGTRATPQQLFSEGYQDLVSLLYFLAIAKKAGELGQARILILDDVLQSVDASIRVSVMDLVVREFKDWQLLMTVHDRFWKTQLRNIFQRAGHPVSELAIGRWGFEAGPQVLTATGEQTATLWQALEAGDPFSACAIAGRLLEQACDRLSWTIPVSVQRRQGDAYTLEDLWPGTMKGLKGTTVEPLLEPVDKWRHLRNTVGAHFNEWAESVSLSEAEAFSLAVMEFLAAVRCDGCGHWVDRSGAKAFSCRCGKTVIRLL